MEDCIIIHRLRVETSIGITPGERSTPQRLEISLHLFPVRPLTGLDDNIANTIDYTAVCNLVQTESEARPRNLIETLADDIASVLLTRLPIRAVEIEVRKFILPGADHAAVHLRRERAQ
jgi:FolB domain-containing protein